MYMVSLLRFTPLLICSHLLACTRDPKWIQGEILETETIEEDPNLAEEFQPDFDGFSSGWYVLDDGIAYETTSNINYQVTDHGDPDLYWYEPSGAHGLLGTTQSTADFALMRAYVLSLVPEPIEVSGPFNFQEVSTLSTFEFATFTYFMCDFVVQPGIDVSRYAISGGDVDDGIQVMLNGEILGRRVLWEGPFSWPLEHAKPNALNTLIIILVDDSASSKMIQDFAFTLDGVMVQ